MKRGGGGLTALNFLWPSVSALTTFPLLSPPSLSPLLSFLTPARRKKRFKQPRKSKWSTGVIKKTKKKRPPATNPSISSSASSKAGSESGPEENGAANGSESGNSEQSHLNGHPHNINVIRNGVLVNGHHPTEPTDLQLANSIPTGRLNFRHRTQTPKTPPSPKTMVNRDYVGGLGLYAWVGHLTPAA